MTALLEIKEKMRRFYGSYSLYVSAGLKFITALVIFTLINQNIGFMTRLKNPAVGLILAMVCAFFPPNVILFMVAFLVLIHLYAASIEFAVLIFVVFLLLFLLYYRFTPKYSFVLLLTPIAFVLKVPYLIPVVMGLIATPVTIIPVSFGVLVYYILFYVKQSAVVLSSTEIESTVQKYVFVIDHVLKSPQMYLTIGAFAVTLIIVYVVRRMSIEHAWTIAMFAGVLVDALVLLAGDFLLDVSIDIIWLFVGSLISVFLAWLLELFLFSVDYSRAEYVQFEDDEYYYYVKAVPKMTITKRDKTVKHINPQKRIKEERRRGTSQNRHTDRPMDLD